MSVWSMTHDCKKCNKPHDVYIAQDNSPEDDAVYAYICPETEEETKFRWKEMAWTLGEVIPENAIEAYLSEA